MEPRVEPTANGPAEPPASDPVGVIDYWIPEDFFRDTLRCLYGACATSYQDSQAYPRPEQHDVLPHIRRARFEAGWRELSNQFPGMRGTAERNRSRNANHTCITCGRVILTESAVEDPGRTIRQADFRDTYARNNQPTLFEEFCPAPDAPLYAILTYGIGADQQRPYFCQVVIPNRENNGYVARIDLFQRFPDLVRALAGEPEGIERIEDAVEPTLRTDLPQTGEMG